MTIFFNGNEAIWGLTVLCGLTVPLKPLEAYEEYVTVTV